MPHWQRIFYKVKLGICHDNYIQFLLSLNVYGKIYIPLRVIQFLNFKFLFPCQFEIAFRVVRPNICQENFWLLNHFRHFTSVKIPCFILAFLWNISNEVNNWNENKDYTLNYFTIYIHLSKLDEYFPFLYSYNIFLYDIQSI